MKTEMVSETETYDIYVDEDGKVIVYYLNYATNMLSRYDIPDY